MIQPNELRIGNWVCDNTFSQYPMQVVLIESDYVYLDFEGNEGDVWECNCKDIEPIPLTDELIISLSSINDKDYKLAFLDHVYIGNALELEYKAHGIWLPTINVGEYDIGKEIHYLHQLQNLYYGLYHEELEVKL